MRGWKLSVFGTELRRVLAYRADFWVNFVGQSFFTLLIAYFLWSSIFETLGVEELNGFTMEKMIVYYLLAPLVFRIQQGETVGSISQEIYEGTLNKYLIYPINFYSYKLVAHLAAASFYLLQITIIVALWQALNDDSQVMAVGAWEAFSFAAAMLLATVAYFCLNSLAELLAFWAEYIWSLGVMLRFIVSFLGGALIPLSFYPEWAANVLAFTPFPYLISFPITALLEGVSAQEFAFNMSVLFFWTVVFYAASRWMWNRGSYRYTGVGM